MATIAKTRKKRDDESIEEYMKEISNEVNYDPTIKDKSAIFFQPETGEHIMTSTENLVDTIQQSRNMKKINFWIDESLIEDIKALQFISGGITLTEAVTFIIKDFFEDFSSTEEYQLYMRLKDKIQKK